MEKINYSSIIKPIPGETACGDIAWIKEYDDKVLLCLIDVLGHGKAAETLAQECIHVLESSFKKHLIEIITLLDKYLKGSRGIVIGLALINIPSGNVDYLGVGNIRTRIIGKQGYRFVSRSGALGISKVHPIQEKYLLNDQDVLLMYSDGITDRFEKINYPEITTDPVDIIPNKICELFSKQNDDASCIAMRYSHD